MHRPSMRAAVTSSVLWASLLAHALGQKGLYADSPLHQTLLNIETKTAPAKSTEFMISPYVNSLGDFNLKLNRADFGTFYTVYWQDLRYSFNGSDLDPNWDPEEDYIEYPIDDPWLDMWLPKITPAIYETYDCTEISLQVFESSQANNMKWTRKCRVTVPCQDTDETREATETSGYSAYPFDLHMCTVKFMEYRFRDHSTLKLKRYDEGSTKSKTLYDSANLATSNYISDTPEWYSIVKVSEAEENQKLHLTLSMQRLPHHLIVGCIMPMLLMVLLTNLSYWIPIEEDGSINGRLTFVLTLLLTLTATALIASPERPLTRHNTWMDNFQGACIFMICLPIFELICIMWVTNEQRRIRELSESSLEGTASEGLKKPQFRNSVWRAYVNKGVKRAFKTLGLRIENLCLEDIDCVFLHINMLVDCIIIYNLLLQSRHDHGLVQTLIETESTGILAVPVLIAFIASLLLCVIYASAFMLRVWRRVKAMQDERPNADEP